MTFDDYVGIPFVEGGRDRSGIDCWGLLRLIYAEQLGVDLPSFAGDYSLADKAAARHLIDGHMSPWREVEAGLEQTGDGLLMSPCHIGVVVAPGLVLHIERGDGAIIERYHGFRLRKRLQGFYRHVLRQAQDEGA